MFDLINLYYQCTFIIIIIIFLLNWKNPDIYYLKIIIQLIFKNYNGILYYFICNSDSQCKPKATIVSLLLFVGVMNIMEKNKLKNVWI